MITAPLLNQSMASLADINVTTTPTQLLHLAPGFNGLIYTAHPANLVNIRVSGSDVGITRGQPIGPGGSIPLSQGDASNTWVCTESGTATLCVSQG